MVFPGNQLFLLPALGLSIFDVYPSTFDCWNPSDELTLPQADLRAVVELKILRFEICSFRGAIVP